MRDGLENKQHDLSLTLRFDINRFWLVKLEGHYMAGTAGLVNPLRFGPPPANPERHWGVFLVKTTAYFLAMRLPAPALALIAALAQAARRRRRRRSG